MKTRDPVFRVGFNLDKGLESERPYHWPAYHASITPTKPVSGWLMMMLLEALFFVVGRSNGVMQDGLIIAPYG